MAAATPEPAGAVTCLAGCGYRSTSATIARPIEPMPLPVAVADRLPPPIIPVVASAGGRRGLRQDFVSTQAYGYRPARSFRRR